MTQWARLEPSKLAVSRRYSQTPTLRRVRGFQTYCSGLVGRQRDLLWDPQQITASPFGESQVGKNTVSSPFVRLYYVCRVLTRHWDKQTWRRRYSDCVHSIHKCYNMLQVKSFATISSFSWTWLHSLVLPRYWLDTIVGKVLPSIRFSILVTG